MKVMSVTILFVGGSLGLNHTYLGFVTSPKREVKSRGD